MPEGGLKALQNKAKNFGIWPFFDPPGPFELFSELFLASKYDGVSPHTDFFASSLNCAQRPVTEERKARSVDIYQILMKTESTKIGYFFQRKIHRFEAIFQDMEV